MEHSKWDDGKELTSDQQSTYKDIARTLYEKLIVHVWVGPRQEQVERATNLANAVRKATDLIVKELY
jgi:hypothetical protein